MQKRVCVTAFVRVTASYSVLQRFTLFKRVMVRVTTVKKEFIFYKYTLRIASISSYACVTAAVSTLLYSASVPHSGCCRCAGGSSLKRASENVEGFKYDRRLVDAHRTRTFINRI